MGGGASELEVAAPSAPAARGQRRRRLRRTATPYVLLSPAALLLVGFFLVPLGFIVVYSFYRRDVLGSMTPAFTLESYERFFESPVYREVLVRTLRLALLTTFITVLLSFPLAYWLAKAQPRLRSLALFGLVISFWTSVIIRSYAWLVLLGAKGLVNDFLGLLGIGPLTLLFNETGVVIGLVHVMIPYMVFPIYASLRAIDPSLDEAAEGLGANGLRRFLRITLPLSVPGLAAGVMLVFIICSGFYLTPALLGGGRVLVIATFVQQQVGLLNYPFASALSVVLLVVVVAVVVLFHRLVGIRRLTEGFDVG
jgi:ABC-type spermidine/putrescine transport system permease subunit I